LTFVFNLLCSFQAQQQGIMKISQFLTFSLWGAGLLVAALPTQTALPQHIPVSSPLPTPTPLLALRAAAPSFTGVHITPFSLSRVSVSLHLPSSTCTQTIKPDKNGYVPPGTCGALWEYYPSFGAAILFSVIFGMLLIAHIAQAIHYKKSFCWVIIMASLWEFGSYGTRAAGSRNQQSSLLATISQILVLLAPVCESAKATELSTGLTANRGQCIRVHGFRTDRAFLLAH
jgi:hypothetical protein